MPEEDLETAELKEQIDQRLEEHEGHGHHGHHDHGKPEQAPGWLRYLSLSTAMIAVFAAVASLESGSNSNEAILEKSEAMLKQSEASDQWAYFQAKGLKETLSEGEAKLMGAMLPRAEPAADEAKGPADDRHALIAELTSKAARYRKEGEEIQRSARELEAQVKERNERSEALMEHHHRFAISVTLLQIAIALSAIAALTRRRPLWFLGMAVSAFGLAMFVRGFL
jgi:chromosome segregation ATPase